ncbi:hypothetical protein [Halobacterium salinarum]|uniref:hypothetical protein n=1 Tax=Halobacterium salinarum TaxID=2242 RepID=UPI002555D9C3|nr:hypothetical protein [Halobacterium salinarum]MDL0133526.1 hypothetical protein [Halobacterium salinarum]
MTERSTDGASSDQPLSFIEWAPGFEIGSTLRNLLVGALYWVTLPVSVFILTYAYMANRERTSAVSRNLLVLCFAFLLVLVLVPLLTGSGAGDTVVDREQYTSTVDRFSAEEGDRIKVHLQNKGTGFRTNVAIEGPDGGVILSESTRDEERYTVELEDGGEYTVRMTPHDSTPSTSGGVTVELLKPGA